MARRRQAEERVSLFPFMSILACLIGILTMMIAVSVIVNQRKAGMAEEDFQRATENRQMEAQIARKKEEIAELEEKNQAAAELAKLQDRIIRLRDTLDELAKAAPDEGDEELQRMLEMLVEETRRLRREQPSLEKRVEQLKAELAKLEKQPEPRESVKITPGGFGARPPRNLFFVECNSTGVILRGPEGETVISTAALRESIEFREFCARAKKAPDSMVLFLVRRAGNDSYNWAAGLAESLFEVRHGKLPVPNEGEIDLSLFNLQ